MSEENEIEVEEQMEVAQDTSTEVIEEVQAEEAKKPEPQKAVDHNWEQARQLMQMQKQRIEELENRQKPAVVPEKDEFADLDPEELVTTSKALQMAKKMATRESQEIRKELESLQTKINLQNYSAEENAMRSKHDDYDYVIDNFVRPMIKNDPAYQQMIINSKNPIQTAYKLGKLSDDYQEQPMKNNDAVQKAEKMIKNSQKPLSGNAAGGSLKGQAEKYAKMSPQDIWKESQSYAKRA